MLHAESHIHLKHPVPSLFPVTYPSKPPRPYSSTPRSEMSIRISQGQKFTKDCKPYQIFLDELCDMTNKDRSKFLDFVTSCPRLPPGGLASLNIEIAPESSKSLYPRSRTCTNLMWLPQYTSREDLRERLHTALANSKDGGFHEHNEVRNT